MKTQGDYRMKKLIFISLVLFLFLFPCVSAITTFCVSQTEAACRGDAVTIASCGKTIYVSIKNTEGPWNGTLEHPYLYIQDGIDAASDGDTIFVFSGIYLIHPVHGILSRTLIYINKSINLIGEGNVTTSIWNVNRNLDWIVKIVADHVNIGGFCFQDINQNLVTPFFTDVKMLLVNASYCIIKDNIFWDGWAGVFTKTSLMIIDGQYNTISNNAIGSHYNDLVNTKGIYLERAHHNIIEGIDIKGRMYGILLNSSDDNSIINNDVQMECNLPIILYNSSRNTILDNTVGYCYSGITLAASSNNNVIGQNQLLSCHYGIFLETSFLNNITFNSFKINKHHAWFRNCSSTWDQNYWGRPRLLPKIIIGEKTVNGKKIIAFQVDWHPAKKCYKI
jgi:parallel beta-helix repeat protein